MRQFTIKRSQWLTGEGFQSKLLRKDDGKMCCLGFLSLACGLEKEDIMEKATPDKIIDKLPEELLPLVFNSRTEGFTTSNICYDIMRVNDMSKCSENEREKKLKSLFKTINFEPIFED